MNTPAETELKVGIFVALGVGLLALSILLLGGADSFFVRYHRYATYMRTADGLIPGAKVVLGGINVGVIENVSFEQTRGDVEIRFKVNSKYSEWLREDSVVEVLTQGVLGDKYIGVTTGALDKAVLPDGSKITSRASTGFSEVIPKAEVLISNLTSITTNLDRILKSLEDETRRGNLFGNLTATSKNLAAATTKLNSEIEGMQIKRAGQQLAAILEKINNGTGTLGSLVNDPGLYDDAKALMGGANRNRVIRNLVRQTVKEGDENAAPEQPKK